MPFSHELAAERKTSSPPRSRISKPRRPMFSVGPRLHSHTMVSSRYFIYSSLVSAQVLGFLRHRRPLEGRQAKERRSHRQSKSCRGPCRGDEFFSLSARLPPAAPPACRSGRWSLLRPLPRAVTIATDESWPHGYSLP